jgi:hypothetical protein
MVRKLFGVLAVALLLCFGAVLADEISGTITKIDTAKKTITVSVDGKESTFSVADDADLGKGRGGDARTLDSLSKQLEKAKDAGRGMKAKLTTSKVKGKEVVTKVETGGRGRGKKTDK